MKLEDWMSANGKSTAWLASATGLSVSYLWRLIPHDGKGPERTPSLDVAMKIYHATGGCVTPNDFANLPAKVPAAENPKTAANIAA